MGRARTKQNAPTSSPNTPLSRISWPELSLLAEIDRDGWNACHVIAKGNTLIHLINGKVMSIVVDDDPHERTRKGLIGMQVHVGPPMKIEFRNIRLKTR